MLAQAVWKNFTHRPSSFAVRAPTADEVREIQGLVTRLHGAIAPFALDGAAPEHAVDTPLLRIFFAGCDRATARAGAGWAVSLMTLLSKLFFVAAVRPPTIFINMKPQKKYLERGREVGMVHVNSAITVFGTRFIYIYRKEEWLKVLTHELIHILGIDDGFPVVAAGAPNPVAPYLASSFEVRWGEAFTEAMASAVLICVIAAGRNATFTAYAREVAALKRRLNAHFAQVAGALLTNFHPGGRLLQSTHAFEYIVAKAALFRAYDDVYRWWLSNPRGDFTALLQKALWGLRPHTPKSKGAALLRKQRRYFTMLPDDQK